MKTGPTQVTVALRHVLLAQLADAGSTSVSEDDPSKLAKRLNDAVALDGNATLTHPRGDGES